MTDTPTDRLFDENGTDPDSASAIPAWWTSTIGYQIEVGSFADADGDGVGDIAGIVEHLGYLELLGVRTLVLSPIWGWPGSPGSAPTMEPDFGDFIEVDRLIEAAHARRLRVVLDVPSPHAEVKPDVIESGINFWLYRGVDGFRLGSAPEPALQPHAPRGSAGGASRRIRAAVEAYSERVVLPGFGATRDEPTEGRYFIHGLCESAYAAGDLQADITAVLEAAAAAGEWPVWFLSHRKAPRAVTALGGGELGIRRARALLLLEFALPGSAFLYYGDELGLSDSVGSAAPADPGDGRNEKDEKNIGDTGDKGDTGVLGTRRHGDRGANRQEMPWEKVKPPPEPGPTRPSTVAQPSEVTVEDQLENADSVLSLVRCAVELRESHPAFAPATVRWYGGPDGCIAFQRGREGLICALNTGRDRVALPPGQVLLVSAPLAGGRLPGDTAAWLIPPTGQRAAAVNV